MTPMSDCASTSRRSRSAVKLVDGVMTVSSSSPLGALLDVERADREAAGAPGQTRAAENRNGRRRSTTGRSGG